MPTGLAFGARARFAEGVEAHEGVPRLLPVGLRTLTDLSS
jgi:hypothetical protein